MKFAFPKLTVTHYVFILIIVAALGAGGYFFYGYQKAQGEIAKLKDPQAAAKEEGKRLVELIGKFVELPQEEPTIATITDKEKVNDQVFFAKAENGDKALIFTQAKKAILYRPSTNKIIEVATINISTSSATPAPAKLKVVLYNGTATTGLMNTAEKMLIEKVTDIEIVAKENAKEKSYEKTLVVDIAGNKKDAADQLAKVISAEVGDLPDGETKPDADILVILGKDFISQ